METLKSTFTQNFSVHIRICKPVISLVHGSKILKIVLETNYYTVLTGLEPVTVNDSTELLLMLYSP